MFSKRFEKKAFKAAVKDNVKTLYRKTIDEATPQQLFQAVSYAVKDVIIDDWIETQKRYDETDAKTVYYMSMEFLMGRALGNNLINMTAYKEVKEALDEMGIDLNVVEDQEPDAALGNGGLGRLAACFLDSLASLGYAAYGCGIRYRYGMFKQKIKDGYQVEVPDNWLKDGNPFEIRRDEYAKEVRFGGTIRVQYNEQTKKEDFIQENYESVLAIPYDMPIVGYGNHVVNTLRICCCGAVLLGRISDVVDYLLYVDKKTGLPNREKLNVYITGMADRILPEDYTCFALQLDNLTEMSRRFGYTVGDGILKDFSGLVQLMGDTDGMVGYNGVGKFLAFFEECSSRKAEVMIRILQSQVDEYNKLNPEYPILFTAAWATTSEEELYHVRDLVRCAQKKMALIAEEGSSALGGMERGEA